VLPTYAMTNIYFRRNLPHIQPPNSTFFVTFRLANSLPKEVVLRLKAEQQEAERGLRALKQQDPLSYLKAFSDQRKRYFGKFDQWLDKAGTGESWLNDSRIAQLVYDAILYRNGSQYDVICFTVMPNHVHMVFSVLEKKPFVEQPNRPPSKRRSAKYLLSPILQSLKWYTAREANKILKRTGSFWQHESYDRVVRDEGELRRIVEYVMNNPVKAGLAKRAEAWKWSYVKSVGK